MISSLLIYTSEHLNPYINLATEKFLFENLPKNSLTLYLWQNENTVVIGKNQNPWAESNCELLKNEGGLVARRMSGGGAVFHDKGNLNFTFIADDENFDISRHLEIIKKGCAECGIEAEISGRNDILANGRKFSGNAFYHSGGRSYHHGTILISGDKEKLKRYLTPGPEKLKAKGVKSVESRTVNLCEITPDLTAEKMKNYIISAAEKELGLKAKFIPLIEDEKLQEDTRLFSSWDFIFGKALPFQVSVTDRLSFGVCELNLNLENGKISEAALFTDALDTAISEHLKRTIENCEFTLEALAKCIKKEFNETISNELIKLIEKALMQ